MPDQQKKIDALENDVKAAEQGATKGEKSFW